MGPMTEDAAVTAPEKSSSYPFLVMASISMAPRPPASATAEPDMPAKIMLATTLEWASPPGIQPTSSLAVSKIFSVILPAFIRLPARINSGTAISKNESAPLTIF